MNPSVFLSFAGMDRPAAKTLDQHLRSRGVDTFLDEHDILSADNIVGTISAAIGESDWFVLLWSRHTVANQFVEWEWTAALMRCLAERRSFLHVVKLDETDLPTLLTPRSFVKFAGNWTDVVDRFFDVWRRDQAVGLPVLPAPRPMPVKQGIEVYVRNRDLAVAHVVPVSPESMGRGLMDVVRESLALPPAVTAFDGQVGARFTYRIEYEGEPLPDNRPLPAPQDVSARLVVDLLVRVEWFGPEWTGGRDDYRHHDDATVNTSTKRRLIDRAFGHLRPGLAPNS